MKIRSVEPVQLAAPSGESSSPWSSTVVLVRVTTSDGLVGWGQAPTTLMTRPVVESVREVARFYEGRELDDHARSFEEYRRYSFYVAESMEATSALSAVDIACWDLKGKELGAPVFDLLGGPLRTSVRAYSNGWYSDCHEPHEFVAKVRAGVAEGFTAFKFDPFESAFEGISPAELRSAVERVAAVREAVGASVDLLIECHGRFRPEAATRIAHELEPYDPRFLEEPLRPELNDALADLRRSTRIPVALGERLLHPSHFESYLRRGLVDILQPDITNCGGLTYGRAIGAIASAVGAPVACHNAFGPVQTAATLQLDATLPTFFLQESFEASWPEWKRSLVRGYRLENGHLSIPDGPGLGIEVDEKAVERFRSDEMEPTGPEPPWVVAGTWARRVPPTSPARRH